MCATTYITADDESDSELYSVCRYGTCIGSYFMAELYDGLAIIDGSYGIGLCIYITVGFYGVGLSGSYDIGLSNGGNGEEEGR